ncbi:AAA family ATPase [Elizabethkingia anophelis]|uniref:AAA family ATPase n=1 Tax=Elizabethkingia anophelis TaxID=1117645 RepID=UPI00038A39E5|nr:AAA family ATPase [Elizabethkingia anophelis]EQB93427.1 ATPase AAA [Elizabethkingia anophelis 502]MCT3921811.1 AAA family ATPase [Elizabethkingia anophelis]MCT3958098.1 AAA family ATPase [Elizabethkingia anophelis]MCT4060748.1 AAA family ATPase [Elizabethkingia anophelis]MCT4107040.1 AAA family ATPase [Elizabethkingia anophelis]
MKLAELTNDLTISKESVKQFIQDFDLGVEDVMDGQLNLKDNFVQFAEENADFLKKYAEDIRAEKTSEEIAQRIKKPVEQVDEVLKKECPNLFEANGYKTSVSSYGIDNKLGGDYNFIYNYFGKQTPLTQHNFIGYRDLFFYVTDIIEPFINPNQLENWGIAKPAGIILYGPPGSGKIFWAKKIAEMIGYEFVEVRNDYLSVRYNDGKMRKFKDFLFGKMKKPKTLLFMEHFEDVALEKTADVVLTPEALEVKNAILHAIQNNLKDEALFVGSTDALAGFDEEILAPGRFDLLIPVFPPNEDERAQLILYHMMKDLIESSPLLKILKDNKADKKPFWEGTAEKMKLFSNTMMIDFTQGIKKRLHSEYMRLQGQNVMISEKIINAALSESLAKLTPDYLNQCAVFISEFNQNLSTEFPLRIQKLSEELDHYRIKEEPIRKIGFNQEDED